MRLPIFCVVMSAVFVLTNLTCKNSPDVVTPTIPDTTSHTFVWKQETLGEGFLHDVALINDSLAYAVGEIFLPDSTGAIDPALYNLAVWNGNTWTVSGQLSCLL